jgi:hypothetical protein
VGIEKAAGVELLDSTAKRAASRGAGGQMIVLWRFVQRDSGGRLLRPADSARERGCIRQRL